MIKIQQFIDQNFLKIIVPFFTILVFQLLLIAVQRRFSSKSFTSFRVTLLGPPGAGKTSSLIALLDYLINSDLSGYLRLRGPSTISNVERGIVGLDQGLFPERTMESSTNVYRLDYFPPLSLAARALSPIVPIAKAFRIEIADFAGELTDQFINPRRDIRSSNIASSFGDDSTSNYLKWVAESDKCLIFIDMEKYLLEGEEFAKALTSKYIAFWQRYLDLHSVSLTPRAGTPVVIVHSKCDVFADHSSQSRKQIDIDDRYDTVEIAVRSDFSKLYRFMKANSTSVDLVFVSVIQRSGDQVRVGIDRLASAMLPNRNYLIGDKHTPTERDEPGVL